MPDKRYFSVFRESRAFKFLANVLVMLASALTASRLVSGVDISCEPLGADIVFAVDTSGSVGQCTFGTINWILSDLIETLTINSDNETMNSRIGYIRFAKKVNGIFQLNAFDSKEEILNQVRNVPAKKGATAIFDTMLFAAEEYFTSANGDRSTHPNVLVIITDGIDTKSKSTLQQARSAVVGKDIEVWAIALGFEFEDGFFESVTGDPDRVVFLRSFFQVNETSRILCDGFLGGKA